MNINNVMGSSLNQQQNLQIKTRNSQSFKSLYHFTCTSNNPMNGTNNFARSLFDKIIKGAKDSKIFPEKERDGIIKQDFEVTNSYFPLFSFIPAKRPDIFIKSLYNPKTKQVEVAVYCYNKRDNMVEAAYNAIKGRFYSEGFGTKMEKDNETSVRNDFMFNKFHEKFDKLVQSMEEKIK